MLNLLIIMKHQNKLLENANKKLQDEISYLKKAIKQYPTQKRKSSSGKASDFVDFGMLVGFG